MKKFLGIIFFLTFTCLLTGETEMRMRHLEDRVSRLEKEKGSSTPQYDQITPNAGPKVYEGMDMFLTLDFLYWTARLDTLSYVQSGVGDLETRAHPPKGEVSHVDWSWDPGFKAGYGWTFCHGGWDLNLQYTWFYSNVGDSKTSSNIQPTFNMVPPFTDPDNIIPIQMSRAHAHWDLHYQLGDLDLSRNYYVNRFLKLRPFIGLKGTWQKQDYNVFFEDVPVQVSSGQRMFDYKMRQDHMVWGVGMRAGLGTSWQFAKWIGFYGDFAVNGLWMHYDLDRKDTFDEVGQPASATTQIVAANTSDKMRIIKPVFEFAIGLRVENYFHCNRLHLLLQGGWEAQIWPSQTIFINLSEQNSRYDLTLQGLTTKFRLDF